MSGQTPLGFERPTLSARVLRGLPGELLQPPHVPGEGEFPAQTDQLSFPSSFMLSFLFIFRWGFFILIFMYVIISPTQTDSPWRR